MRALRLLGLLAVVVASLVVMPKGLAASGGGAVTGFGATDAIWNKTHTADKDFAPGSVYNADSSLPKINGHTGAQYTTVMHEARHVLGYDYHFRNEPISTGRALVLRTELPSNSRIVWFARKGTCAQMSVRSQRLGQALGAKAIGDNCGAVLIEFSSGLNEDRYNARSVNDALFFLASLEPPSQAGAC